MAREAPLVMGRWGNVELEDSPPREDGDTRGSYASLLPSASHAVLPCAASRSSQGESGSASTLPP